jgi:hypothetical protein
MPVAPNHCTHKKWNKGFNGIFNRPNILRNAINKTKKQLADVNNMSA